MSQDYNQLKSNDLAELCRKQDLKVRRGAPNYEYINQLIEEDAANFKKEKPVFDDVTDPSGTLEKNYNNVLLAQNLKANDMMKKAECDHHRKLMEKAKTRFDNKVPGIYEADSAALSNLYKRVWAYKARQGEEEKEGNTSGDAAKVSADATSESSHSSGNPKDDSLEIQTPPDPLPMVHTQFFSAVFFPHMNRAS